ncbi:MAG: acylneuraminate cytidylyltransferase family protein [Bacteroidia bacterium]|nr:acylneuraminate cytidylyltransferase family protein [Bacteroidia bacterium]NNC86185.1 acylneuraminate cytidylyltransferase family protein [Bacteroidia bacterium]
MTILITICARGGSKGVPGKNIKEINGIPLIVYSINAAKKFAKKFNSTIALSTDDSEILKVCEQNGISTDYVRPTNLAGDEVGKIAVIEHLLKYQEEKDKVKYDYILDLDVTSPLRTIEDLKSAYSEISNNPEALNIISVSECRKNPYFNLVELNADGFASLSKKLTSNIYSRQKAPSVFEVNGSFYFYKRAFFNRGNTIALEENKTLVYKMNHECFDVDTKEDFLYMQYLIENKKLSFSIT